MITQTHMTFIGIAGSLYISYLAWRVYFANPIIDPTNQLSLDNRSKFALFKDGFLMQTLNPKGIVATLPVGAIYFPTLKLTDGEIIFGSAILALLAMCAPGGYSLLGKFANSAIRNPKYFLVFNKILAALLVWTAISICLDLV